MNRHIVFTLSVSGVFLGVLAGCGSSSSTRSDRSATTYQESDGTYRTDTTFSSDNTNLVSNTGTSDDYRPEQGSGVTTVTTTTVTSETPRSTSVTTRDAEILALLVAIDDMEVRAGANAEKKQLRSDVRDFAKMMQTEHSRHADDTRSLAKNLGITLTDTSDVTAQRDKGDQELASLDSFEGEAYDRAYLDAMVKGHEDVLAKLDGSLKSVDRDEVRTHLQKTRDAVSRHLDQARKLQSNTPR